MEENRKVLVTIAICVIVAGLLVVNLVAINPPIYDGPINLYDAEYFGFDVSKDTMKWLVTPTNSRVTKEPFIGC